jgi:tetratricopeptide (TPR) repeat protein
MPMQERVQLARALAEKHGFKITDVEDWRPLLRFTQGNPLTLTVVVGQALRLVTEIKDPDEKRQKKKRTNRLQEYLEQLRRGESAFPDEAAEGRAKSLGASLSYGFESAFSPEERKILALLHFFQGFVNVNVLRQMGNLKKLTGEDYSLPELTNLQPATFNALLDRAAETGLLTPHGDGYYTIHPALPWFFKTLFDQSYPAETPPPPGPQSPITNYQSPIRAFVESLGELGNYYHNQYEGGNRNVIAALRAEEANLLYARALARQHGLYWRITSTMQGLNTLYDHTGRRAEWRRLVEEIVPDFVGADDLPLPGREEQWSMVTQWRVFMAQESRDWPAAERLQRVCVDWDRRNAAVLLARPPESLSANEKNSLRTLAVSMEQLGQIQRDIGMTECVQTMQDAIPICQQIGDRAEEAVLAFNLGHAYKNLPALRDLDAAEGWYQRSLALRAEGDRKGRAITVGQLGLVAYERFRDAEQAGESNEALGQHLQTAADYYGQALSLLPPDAVNDLAVTHNQLGVIYNDAGDLERALEHYNQSINYKEMAGNQYGAGQTRFNIAVMLAQNGRAADALLYARAALRNFEPYGQGAAKDIEDTKGLIAWIEGLMSKQ